MIVSDIFRPYARELLHGTIGTLHGTLWEPQQLHLPTIIDWMTQHDIPRHWLTRRWEPERPDILTAPPANASRHHTTGGGANTQQRGFINHTAGPWARQLAHSFRTVQTRSAHNIHATYNTHPGATDIYSQLPRMPQSILGLTSRVRTRSLVTHVHEPSARQQLIWPRQLWLTGCLHDHSINSLSRILTTTYYLLPSLTIHKTSAYDTLWSVFIPS